MRKILNVRTLPPSNTVEPFTVSKSQSLDEAALDLEWGLDNFPESDRNQIVLDKVVEHDQNALLGKVSRHFITGKPIVKGPIDPQRDFNVVDLYTRDYILGTPEQIREDPYIFKPIPLKYHTWFWHYTVDEMIKRGGIADLEDHGIWIALEPAAVDYDARAGNQSPLQLYAPGALAALLTQNAAVIIAHILVTIFTFICSFATNTPSAYAYGRLASLPFRVGLFVMDLYFLLFDDFFGDFDALALLGFLIHLGMVAYEIVIGDLAWCLSAVHSSSYSLLKKLSDTVFVCRRQGGNPAQEFFGGHKRIPMEVTGVPPDSETALVANIQGILVELRPLSNEECQALLEHWLDPSQAKMGNTLGDSDADLLRFYGIDVYTEEYPTAYHLDQKTKVVPIGKIDSDEPDTRPPAVVPKPRTQSQMRYSSRLRSAITDAFETPRDAPQDYAPRSRAQAGDQMVLQEVDEHSSW